MDWCHRGHTETLLNSFVDGSILMQKRDDTVDDIAAKQRTYHSIHQVFDNRQDSLHGRIDINNQNYPDISHFNRTYVHSSP